MNASWSRLIRVPVLGLVWIALPLVLLAQPAANDEQIPPLRPPKTELPPGWWEQNGFWVLAGVLIVLTLSAAGALLWLRLRKPAAPAPVRRAHQELEPLVGKAEDGLVLTRASQTLKEYFQSAFSLPKGELTTAEFCHVIDADAQIGSELGLAVAAFLRRCDHKKFAPVVPPEPLNAARTALTLVDTGERRRLELAQQTEEARGS